MADNKKQYEEAMKNLEALVNKQKALNKSIESMKESWSSISSEVFKISGAEWFDKVPMAAKDIKKINDEIKNLENELGSLENSFNNALNQDNNYDKLKALSDDYFSELTKGLDGYEKDTIEYYDQKAKLEKKLLSDLKKSQKEISSMSQDDLTAMLEHLHLGGQLSDVYGELNDESQRLLLNISKNPEEMMEMDNAARKVQSSIDELNGKIKDGTKETISFGKAFSAMRKNIVQDGIGALLEFDKVLNKVQKETGINMDGNSQKFGELTRNVAQFGMSVEQAGQMMADMSDELNTTNFSVLSKAAEDFAAIEGATGASSKEITTISGQLMRMGKSSEAVKDYFDDASKMAQKFGVSSKRAIDGISRNITKMRSMGFVGGEKSLAKMVVTAEKLNQNIDEVFDVAKRARTIEGAMEMASELQLAGGSFANINPMDLLAAARKGPAELQKILTQMGSDVGRFNKETGQYEFDPVDVDRLQMVADATGQSLDNIMNGIQKSGLDKEKLEPFSGMMDGLDEADKALAQSSLGDMMKWDEKSGSFKIDADNDLAKKMGIDSIDDINGDMITTMLQTKKDDAKNLEEQNKRNQSFQESLKNFWDSIQSLFYIFEPVLSSLTKAIQFITKAFTGFMGLLDGLGVFGTIIKWAIPLFLLASTTFGTSVTSFITKGVSGFAKGIAGSFSKIKGLFGGAGKTGTTDISSNAQGPKPGVGGGLKSLAEGLGSMGTTPGVLKGILAVALSGPAFLLFVPALPGLLIMAGIGAMDKLIVKGFTAIADGLAAFGNAGGIFKGIAAIALASIPLAIFGPLSVMLLPLALIGALAPLIEGGFKAIANGIGFMGQNLGNIVKGSLAILVVGAAMIPFAIAASYMSDIDWMSVLAGVGIMALVMVGLIAVGAMAMTVGWLILAGAGLLAAAGVAMAVAAWGLNSMGEAFGKLSEIDTSNLGSLASVMFLLGPGLLAFSAALIVLSFVSFESLSQLGGILTQLGAVNIGNLSALGTALGSMAPGLSEFAWSAMAFANPIALLGIWAMTSALSDLVTVMAPLASALTLGSGSLNSFASGLDRLATAANALSDDKLERLQKISEAMASASAAGNVADVVTAISGGGAGGAGAEPRKIEIDIKLNGRDVQYQIVKDTAVHK